MLTVRYVASLLICIFAVGHLGADEVSIPLDKLPKEVVEAVKKRFPKGTLLEAAKETDGDKVEYEVTLKEGEMKIDVMLTADGKITLIEKLLPTKDLPKAITDVLEAKYPKATHQKAEEVIKVTDGKEALDFYEVLLQTADKKTIEVKIAADGKIKAVEEKKEGDKEEKKG